MVSVIIPTYNEEKIIGNLLSKLTSGGSFAQIIVSDGCSTDSTAKKASGFNVKLLVTQKQRARQLNEAAKIAKGQILVFLYADCYIEPKAIDDITKAIEKGYLGGCLSQKINSNNKIFKIIAESGNLRARFSRIFYGDQVIFVRRDKFFELGGFDEVDIFDDVLFSRKLRRAGKTLALKTPVVCSARRWQKQGVIKTTIINWIITCGFLLNVSTKVLKKIYLDIR